MIKNVMKKEPVLSIAVILAVISMFVVHPDDTYASYIDFRTLAILFCLMVIVAGMREIGVFDYIAQSLLNRVKSISGIVMILVLLCFFLSMVITNDVALIIGTNLGGLGTMIASMASLISFKYISREDASLRGKYFIWFTAANVILLVILLAAAKILGQL